VFSASGLMGALRHALSRAFDVEEQRPPLLGKLLDIGLVFAIGLIAGASVGLSVAARLTVEVSAWVSQLAPLVLATIVFALLYRFVPARRVRWRQCLPGALLAGLGYEAIKRGFAFYLDKFATYGAVYGSIAAVIILLVWLYWTNTILLFGGEMNATLQRHGWITDLDERKTPNDLRPRSAQQIGGATTAGQTGSVRADDDRADGNPR
jgi:membrane protein